MTDVWLLGTTDNTSRVLRSNVDFFRNHFVGEHMINTWHPPEIRICNTSKKLKDFLSWMLCAPVVSEHAKDILKPLVQQYVEFLPLIKLGKVQYFAINVLCRLECLDVENSNIVRSPTDNRIIDVFEYSFLDVCFYDYPIFILKEFNSPVFVTRTFVDRVLEERLTGAQFLDPAANQYKKMLAGIPLNVVEGALD